MKRFAIQVIKRGEALVGTLWREPANANPGLYVEVVADGKVFRREGPITDEDTGMMRIGELMDEASRPKKTAGLRRRNY